jgi:hypothetical protein
MPDLLKRALVLAACLAASRAWAEQADKALLVTVKWDEAGVTIEKVEARELPVPLQRGFPQLWSRFFELRDAQDNVHYAGPLIDPRSSRKPEGDAPPGWTFRLAMPDLPEARRLVIIERVPADEVDKTRKVVKDETLNPEN